MTTVLLTVNERVTAVVLSGLLPDDDEDVVRECARRYVVIEHRRLERNASRDLERNAKIRRTASLELMERVRSLTTDIKLALVLEGWSPELLDSSFVAGNERVTWRDATVEQHEARAQMLEGMAAGDLQTASIHRQAVHDIRAVGGSSLGEVVSRGC